MLRRLVLRDFVIVDRLELEFQPGFGALTGETGAGKSILVDALSLALGDRADASVVRLGRERAEISAEFQLPPGGETEAWLQANDFPVEEGCLLRRVVDGGGRSRAYVNGSPATLTQLRQLGELCADIHGQHAHHALLRADAQRALVDEHGGLCALAKEVAERYRAWQRLADARAEAEHNAQALVQERELLEWQCRELEEAGFEPQQWLEIQQEQRRLGNAAALIEGVEAALQALDDGEAAAAGQLRQAGSRIGQLAALDPGLEEARGLLEGAAIQLDEAVHGLRRYRDHLDLDPGRLAELESRIEAVQRLARKHRVAPEALPEVQAQLAARLAEMQALADPEALARREAESRRAYLDVAEELSRGRRKAAAALSGAVSAAMQDLALAGGRFEAALEPIPDGAACGLEQVEFRVSTNKSQPVRPLAKVASGGELSRIGLAIQVIASQAGQAATLVFDEVDVGIGGRVAEIVGRLLGELGRSRQVLCVTHLPQVAARADWQWSIAKQDVGAETLSRVIPLDHPGRIEEIARMLGGMHITDTTRRHAAELLGADLGR